MIIDAASLRGVRRWLMSVPAPGRADAEGIGLAGSRPMIWP